MFLKALVLDTNNFSASGKIRVRIASKYLGNMYWDLSKNTEFIKDGTKTEEGSLEIEHSDFDVYVFSPFGVGGNSSSFYLPRVNSIGLVAPLGALGSSEYVWIGGYFEPVLDSSFTNAVNIPSDKENDATEHGASNGQFTIDRDNAFILRFKSTKMPRDYNNASDKVEWFDFSKRNTENLVVINDYKISTSHFIEYSEASPVRAQTFFMGTEITKDDNGAITEGDSKIKLEQYTISNDVKKARSIELGEENIIFYNYISDNTSSSISLKKSGVNIYTMIDGKEVEYRQNKNGVSIAFGGTSINISGNSISINADKTVYISAPQVRLGNTDQRIVTTTSTLSNFKIADGVILNTSTVGYA